MVLLAACDDTGTSAGARARTGIWGASGAVIRVNNGDAMIQIADGGCYGSFATTHERIPGGAFTIDGTFTQLMGVAPGRVDYSAQLSGFTAGDRMWITIDVPELSRTLGPYAFVHGTGSLRSACLYP